MNLPSRPSHSGIWLQVITLVAIFSTFIVNAWSNAFPINGENIGELANTLFSNVLVIPANYAFAIWGFIYLGLIAFGIYQFLPAQRHDPVVRRVDYLLITSCIVQAAWVILFLLRQFWWSVAAMLGILFCLIGIYLTLGVGKRRISRQEKWFAHIPFSVYLGWISVATIVNIASALYFNTWNGGGIAPVVWTLIMLVISGAIAALIALQRRDIAFPLVIIWAFIAIAIRQSAIPSIAGTAIGLSVVLAVLVAIVQFRSSRRNTRLTGDREIRSIEESKDPFR